MRKLGAFLIVGFLFSCVFAASSASAAECYSTREAMAYVSYLGVKPMVLRGDRAREFVPVSGAGLKTVQFAALIFKDDGAAAVFFGNLSQVCGPFRLSKEQVIKFLRPA